MRKIDTPDLIENMRSNGFEIKREDTMTIDVYLNYAVSQGASSDIIKKLHTKICDYLSKNGIKTSAHYCQCLRSSKFFKNLEVNTEELDALAKQKHKEWEEIINTPYPEEERYFLEENEN